MKIETKYDIWDIVFIVVCSKLIQFKIDSIRIYWDWDIRYNEHPEKSIVPTYKLARQKLVEYLDSLYNLN